jgi:hypothetical protein
MLGRCTEVMRFIPRCAAILTSLCVVVSACTFASHEGSSVRLRQVVAWGDSLTYALTKVDGEYRQANPTWLETAGATLGIGTVNLGVPTQGSAEIAVRQGGLKPRVTLNGNGLTAHSVASVPITAITPPDGWTQVARAGTMRMHGALSGVAGTLQHTVETGVSTFAFVPDVAPAEDVSIPPGSEFSGDDGNSYRNSFQLIWAGANNGSQTAAIIRDIASMVSWLPYPRNFLVIGTVPQVADALSAAYGLRFVDLNSWLVTHGLGAAAVSPTAADSQAMDEGKIPPSLLVDDGIHYTQAAYTAVGKYLASVIAEVG